MKLTCLANNDWCDPHIWYELSIWKGAVILPDITAGEDKISIDRKIALSAKKPKQILEGLVYHVELRLIKVRS